MSRKIFVVLFICFVLIADVSFLWACDCCKKLSNITTGENYILEDAYDSSWGAGASYYASVSVGQTRHYCEYSNGGIYLCEILGSC